MLPKEYSGTPNSAQLARSGIHLGAGHRVGDRQVDVDRRDVVVLGRQREIWSAHRPPRGPQAVERLWARDLVHEVQVDVEQVGFALGTSYDVGIPDLLGERASHDRCPL